MRITQPMLTANTLRYSQASYERLSTLQEQLSTQKKISRFSQNPVIAVKSMQYRESQALNTQYKRNINEAHNWLDQSDTSLRETTNVLNRVRELAVKASTGTYGPDERKSVAQETEELRNHLMTIANTSTAGKYIFNGTNTSKAPITTYTAEQLVEQDLTDVKLSFRGEIYDYIEENGQFESRNDGSVLRFEDGQFFNEAGDKVDQDEMLIQTRTFDQNGVELELQQGVYVKVNAEAHRLFSDELFNDLFAFEQALLNPDVTEEELGKYIDKIDTHLRAAADVNGQLGARMNRVDLIEDRLEQQDFLLKKIKSQNEDVDFEETVMKLLVAEGIHSAALAASARVIQPSLLDFLR
ncbi:flagellar hook-associated protein FlgL [Shouchella patagoniensis]|uniref:flagellar hook-associated protein FlgL n=1 Tax=Shouchella patagoniensis TaxID=228576 RepID=UPI0009951381|nr:flagellar hook-associated protein FlgL [Shouchella patagoniensis]